MGIIAKLMDNGYYEAFGRNAQINFSESLAEKWEPLMTQGMILVFVAFGVGLMLANLTFIVELSMSAWIQARFNEAAEANHNLQSSYCVATVYSDR